MSPVLRNAWRAMCGGLLLWSAALLLGCAPPLQAQQPSPLPAPAALLPPLLTPPSLAPPALAPTAIKQIAAGGGHTCVLTNAGAARCWGDNQQGALGNGTRQHSWRAVDVVGLAGGVQVLDAGMAQTCALGAEGRVQCWGAQALTPEFIEGLGDGVQSIAVGNRHACAVTAAGGVKCWGENLAGQLGDGAQEWRPTPVDVAGLDGPMRAVAAGSEHTCALSTWGGVTCWGSNTLGQLGDGGPGPRSGPVHVLGLDSGVQALTAGSSHTCALLLSGGVQCWGANFIGQLGAGPDFFEFSARPLDVVGLSAGVRHIDAGDWHTCALVAGASGNAMQCWGGNPGALGDGTLASRRTPITVAGLAGDVRSIGIGGNHSCALLENGGIQCWGDNWYGQLGSGPASYQALPQPVAALDRPVQAVVTGDSHTCVLTTGRAAEGGVLCWGDNTEGQLGDGTTASRYQPAPVSGLASGVQALAAGRLHTCALSTGGGVQCWGNNTTGQLGDGTGQWQPGPVGVVGLGAGVQAITAGRGHSCALTAAGGVKCWGDNKGGQLGDGTQLDSKQPVDVVGLGSGVRAVAAGLGLTCALNAHGGVQCWGAGPVGDGARNLRPTPVDVAGLDSGVQAITVGDWHACALTLRGGVKCWGRNEFGQLGDGSRLERLLPVNVVGLPSGVQAIDANGDATCALLEDGGVSCWGWGHSVINYQEGEIRQHLQPAPIQGLAGSVQAVSVGGGHKCVLAEGAAAGSVQCWGLNRSGQLGVNPGWAPMDVLALLPRALFAPVVRQ